MLTRHASEVARSLVDTDMEPGLRRIIATYARERGAR
jgi:hypothetical protein